MKLEELDELFWNTENRHWGVFYYCKSDPRVVAPSRPDWRGYQINFAHPWALSTLLLYLTVLVIPVASVFLIAPESIVTLVALAVVTFVISILALITLSAHLSRRHTTP